MDEIKINKNKSFLFILILLACIDILLFAMFGKLIEMAALSTLYIKLLVFFIAFLVLISSLWIAHRLTYMVYSFIKQVPLMVFDSSKIFEDSIFGTNTIYWDECLGYSYKIFNGQMYIHIEVKDYDVFIKNMPFLKRQIYKLNSKFNIGSINIPMSLIKNNEERVMSIINSKLKLID